MRQFSHTFSGAGEQITFPGGNFFQILELDTSTVQVEFLVNDSINRDEGALDASAGYVSNQYQLLEILNVPLAFSGVRVTSNAAQVIKVGISRGIGGLNRFTGDVNITNSSLAVANTPVKTTIEDGFSTYVRSNSAATVQTIVTPAANTDGVVIYSMLHMSFNNINTIMLKTSAPSAWNDSAAKILSLTNWGSGYGEASKGAFPVLPLLIEAGIGIYEMSGGATPTHVALIYEVL